jgi:hypothetical protein
VSVSRARMRPAMEGSRIAATTLTPSRPSSRRNLSKNYLVQKSLLYVPKRCSKQLGQGPDHSDPLAPSARTGYERSYCVLSLLRARRCGVVKRTAFCGMV